MKNLIPMLAALIVLAGCDALTEAQQAEKGPAIRLPKQVCDQAREGLDKLTESGGFVYAGGGEATLEEAAWLRLDGGARDQLMQLLAYDAACTAKEPPYEWTARVRNEVGRILEERVVETSADPSRILEEQPD